MQVRGTCRTARRKIRISQSQQSIRKAQQLATQSCRPRAAAAQSSYTAQLSGVVSDSSGGVIPGAKVTLTDEGTGVASTLNTDERGIFVFTGIRPSTYTISVSAPGLNTQERKGVVLAVSQQANLDF